MMSDRLLGFRFPSTRPRLWPAVGIALLTTVLLSGCSEQEEIVVYEVPKSVPEQLLPGKERLLGAIVPRGEKVWFFKLRGPQKAVDLVDEEFEQYFKAIKFNERGEPVLEELPEGWRKGGRRPMRFATIDINTPGKQLDVSISDLPPFGEWPDYVKQNVNRWRGQVNLPESDEKFAGAMPVDIAAAEGQAVWVDLLGEPGDDSMMSSQAPFAPFASNQNAGPQTPRPKPLQLDYETPESWREGKAGGMRMAEFQVGPEDKSAEVTVISAGGDLRSNVARWMGQVAGAPPEDAAVDTMLEAAEKFEVSGRPAQRFVIPGDAEKDQTSIDATIVDLDGQMSLFIKMTGPPKTVQDESDAMRTFLESLTLER
jgi:hypothetical protein